jgi:DNA-binding CsgD family transcriptional regulator
MGEVAEVGRTLPYRPHHIRVMRMCEAEYSRLKVLAGSGTPQLAASAWKKLADEFEGDGQRYEAAFARSRAVELRLAGGGLRSEVSHDLRMAHETATSLGARPLAAELERVAAQARIPLGPIPMRRPTGLCTPRQLEVLALVSAGMTNRQIATTLFITEKTAGLHVSNLLAKLGVANRAEATARAIRLGLLSESLDVAPPMSGSRVTQ